LSGPLLDRIDLQVAVRAVPWKDLESPRSSATSQLLGARVLEAQRLQQRRGFACNSAIPDRELDDRVDATPDARLLLGRAVERFGLTARGARRGLRVARTCADLSGEPRVGPAAMAEALSFRLPQDA
jgi:magnesium chelatase family protein